MSAALDRYTALFGDGNIRAFLHVIREGESSHDDSAYTVINGGSHFSAPPWRHPHDGVPTTQGGKASGAYQFLGTTWRGCADALGLGADFSPASQDAAAVYLIDRRHALAQVMAGNVLAACALLADEWVSLPHLGAERIKRVFQAYGGKLAAQTIPAQDRPTPQPEPKPAPAPDPGPQRTNGATPMPVALILGLAQSIFSMFAPLAQQKIAKELERHTDEGTATTISQGVIDKIIALTNPANPTEAIQAAKTDSSVAIQAVAKAQQDAAIIAKAQDYTMEALDKMAPMLDRMAERDKETWQADIASADAAGMRGRQDPWDIAKFVVIGVGALVFLIDGALLTMMIIQTVRTANGEISSTLVAFAGPLLMASIMWFGTIVAYRFGEKRSSSANEASNAIIAQYARRS